MTTTTITTTSGRQLRVPIAALVAALGLAGCAGAGQTPAAPAASPVIAAGRTAAAPRVIFDRVSPYARVLVIDEGGRRVMRFGSPDGADQSVAVLGRPDIVPVEYVRHALLGLAHRGHVRRLLMVGLGGGTFTGLVHRAFAEIEIEVIEIDPVVVEAARQHFGVQEDGRHRIILSDAARWMRDSLRVGGIRECRNLINEAVL